MRPIPFSVVAPATIVFFGASVAIATIFFGLGELKTQAAHSAQFHVQTLAQSFSERVSATSREDIEGLLAQGASRGKATLIVVDTDGNVRHAQPNQPLSLTTLGRLIRGQGTLLLEGEPHRYAVSPIDGSPTRLIAVAPLPATDESEKALVSSVATFSILLLAAAGFVGWALARDVHADVLFVGRRIAKMADDAGPPVTRAVPVRTIDQVGQLTASFNMLLERFQAAERAYRQDLSQARNFAQDRTAFLAALSHELRTPLNAILGFADVLLDEIDGPLSEESKENLTIVRTSGEHLRSLIDDILALSALESGEFRLSRERLDIASVALDVVNEARVTAEQRGLSVVLTHPDNCQETEAYADRRRMRQILGNIVSNAVKFTQSGSIEVRVWRQGEFVMTTVKDTGPGIAKEQLEDIFEEFRQADSSNAQRMGTGLGLSITRRLVQMHGGRVHAESTLGEGSTFTIRIPVDEDTAGHVLPIVRPASNPIIRQA